MSVPEGSIPGQYYDRCSVAGQTLHVFITQPSKTRRIEISCSSKQLVPTLTFHARLSVIVPGCTCFLLSLQSMYYLDGFENAVLVLPVQLGCILQRKGHNGQRHRHRLSLSRAARQVSRHSTAQCLEAGWLPVSKIKSWGKKKKTQDDLELLPGLALWHSWHEV